MAPYQRLLSGKDSRYFSLEIVSTAISLRPASFARLISYIPTHAKDAFEAITYQIRIWNVTAIPNVT